VLIRRLNAAHNSEAVAGTGNKAATQRTEDFKWFAVRIILEGGTMATTAEATHVPVEVYLKSSYEPDAEYVDGVIEERPMGEFDHCSW
jgi:hypothetical protein